MAHAEHNIHNQGGSFIGESLTQLVAGNHINSSSLTLDTEIDTPYSVLKSTALSRQAQLVNKGNIGSGAIAAASAEIAAPLLAEMLYGTSDPSKLDESPKRTLIDLSSAVAGIASGLVGSNGNSTDITQAIGKGMKIGENAVENNYLYNGEVNNLIRELAQAEKEGKNTQPIFEKYATLSKENRKDILQKCGNNPTCYIAHIQMMKTGDEEAYENFSALRFTTYFNGLSEDTRARMYVVIPNKTCLIKNSTPYNMRLSLSFN